MLKLTLCFFLAMYFPYASNLKLDFGAGKSGSDWNIINDTVMGGRSSSNAQMNANGVKITGAVSLANNGGFSSFRSPFERMDLSSYKEVEIRMRSKGQGFAFVLETNPNWWMPNYKKVLKVEGEDWQTIRFDLDKLQSYQIGRPTGRMIKEGDLAKVIRIGFITNDKKACDFELEVDYILFK